MTNDSPQTIAPLTAADEEQLRQQRALVEKYLGDETSRENYEKAAGKLGLIRALLANGVFKTNQTYELQCLGVVLGDAFVQELKMEWVVVEDEHGRSPAVRVPGKSILLNPITMISKRIERAEKVDVFDMFNWAAEKIDEMQKQGFR
jgi:hypothetical protein